MIPFRYIWRSLFVRRGASLSAAIGSALVVFLLAGSLMLANGVRRTFVLAARSDEAIVLRQGAESENMSLLGVDAARVVLTNQNVERSENGTPLAAAELLSNAAMPKIGANGVANVQIRGVERNVREFRPEVRLVAGRWPAAGAAEAVVGQRIAGRFEGLTPGGSVLLKKNRPVQIVGVFAAADSSYESELWTDRELAQSAFGRTGTVSAIRAHVGSHFQAFKREVEADKRVGGQVLTEAEYYAKQSSATASFLAILGNSLCAFFAIAAILGGTSTMQSSVARRLRELGVLRALGFSRRSILLAVVLESAALAAFGSLFGTALALALSSVRFSMMNFSSWSEIVFKLEPSVEIIAIGVVGALLVGVLAGVLPAIRAARLSTNQALKA
ncbi:MAG TPA: ABC transporter permease [Polyangiaceae bacterium]|nr:ABC transporter permease [Polyangiaceae bacterium]